MTGLVLLCFGLCGVILAESAKSKNEPFLYKAVMVICIITGAIAIPVGAIISIWF